MKTKTDLRLEFKFETGYDWDWYHDEYYRWLEEKAVKQMIKIDILSDPRFKVVTPKITSSHRNYIGGCDPVV